MDWRGVNETLRLVGSGCVRGDFMAEDDWKKERDERLQRLGLRPGPDSRPRCIHCGRPFDILMASAAEHGLCDDCLFDD